jgi:hypothetical protein
MQVLLGSGPPAPPPNVPALVEAGEEATAHTVRQRMEEHRKNPACASCHRVIDPIGFSLENFDPTGVWRSSDSGVPLDTTGKLFDGTPLKSPADLRDGILNHREAFLRAFAGNLYAYGLGRIPDYRDMPEIRSIVSRADKQGNRFSQYVLGIVESPAFMTRALPAQTPAPGTNPQAGANLKAASEGPSVPAARSVGGGQ